MAAQTNVEIQIHSQTTCIVTLRGEHDASSREAITLALAAARSYGNVLVDLSSCTFVDSSVITALLAAGKRARQIGGTLELVAPSQPNGVRRTLEIANVQMFLPFHATREDGIAMVERRAAPRPGAARADLRAVGTHEAHDASPAPRRPARPGTMVIRAQVVPDGVDLTAPPPSALRPAALEPLRDDDPSQRWDDLAA